jgi:TDG/mug DNA glycosylase family protein
VVTARELAHRLRVDPKRLRDWLRAQAKAGHPILADHVHNARWEFGEDEAEQLAREFSGATVPTAAPPPCPPRSNGDPPGATGHGHRVTENWRGHRVETLADLLRPGLRAACIGINPSPVSVARGHYYQGQIGRRFWRRLRETGAITEAGTGREDDEAFAAGIGFTDIVKRPTARAAEIGAAELAHGRELLAAKLHEHRPALLIFTFKKTAVALLGPFDGHGRRPEFELAGAGVFVMPGPYERADRVGAALDELRGLLAQVPGDRDAAR